MRRALKPNCVGETEIQVHDRLLCVKETVDEVVTKLRASE